MSFSLFLFASVSQVAFRFLPTEVVCLIFRYLDDDSLLNAFVASNRWAAICREDPILRKRIRNRLVQHQKEKRRVILDPSAGVVIHRTEPAMCFGRNQQTKQVFTSRKLIPELPLGLPKITKNSTGRAIRRRHVRKITCGKIRI